MRFALCLLAMFMFFILLFCQKVYECVFTSRYIMDIEREECTILEYNIMCSAIGAFATYSYKYINKEPCMTSLQRGENWMYKILNGHQCLNVFRTEQSLFTQLCEY